MCSLGIGRHLVGLMAAKGQATGEIEFVVDKMFRGCWKGRMECMHFGTCGLR